MTLGLSAIVTEARKAFAASMSSYSEDLEISFTPEPTTICTSSNGSIPSGLHLYS